MKLGLIGTQRRRLAMLLAIAAVMVAVAWIVDRRLESAVDRRQQTLEPRIIDVVSKLSDREVAVALTGRGDLRRELEAIAEADGGRFHGIGTADSGGLVVFMEVTSGWRQTCVRVVRSSTGDVDVIDGELSPCAPS
jgi:hypothetical protein